MIDEITYKIRLKFTKVSNFDCPLEPSNDDSRYWGNSCEGFSYKWWLAFPERNNLISSCGEYLCEGCLKVGQKQIKILNEILSEKFKEMIDSVSEYRKVLCEEEDDE